MDRELMLWEGKPLAGCCGHCRRLVDSSDPDHRVTAIMRGGHGVECVLRGDIEPEEGGLLCREE